MKRRNMAPFMLTHVTASGNRYGLFFVHAGNGKQLQAYLYDNFPTTINAFDDWQIVSFDAGRASQTSLQWGKPS